MVIYIRVKLLLVVCKRKARAKAGKEKAAARAIRWHMPIGSAPLCCSQKVQSGLASLLPKSITFFPIYYYSIKYFNKSNNRRQIPIWRST